MIKQFIDKLLGKTSGSTAPARAPRTRAGARPKRPDFGRRVEVPASEHRIDPALLDRRAVEVVHTLKQAGFEAYVVGGAVRDLLLGLQPKDFDVATNATPEQVKALFRRAFIIGRRFRIVHVVHGRGREHEVIEVSTFRAHLDNAAAEQVPGNEKTSKSELAALHHAVDASGRVLRDNVWGPQDQDATRRDFTVNAMYYDPETQVVVDYHGGIADARKKTLRMIGDAAARYREDPVRIVRAVRFAAKLAPLGFTLERGTAAPLIASQALLADVPQSRMFDEMLKLLQTGHAIASVAQLRALGMARGIYPLLDVVVERADDPFVHAALVDTDRRVAQGKPVAPSFLLAAVLWEDVRTGWQRRTAQAGQHLVPALHEAIDEVFDRRIGDVSGRGRLAADMREIWVMQPRFERRGGHAPFGLADQPRFRAGFDFMRLRADVGEVDEALADWWQEFSTADDARRQDLVEQAREEQKTRGRKPGTGEGAAPQRPARVRVRKPAGPAAAAEPDGPTPADARPAATDTGEGADETGPAAGDAPARRRRRRRKPASRDPDAAPGSGAGPHAPGGPDRGRDAG